jgi:poly-gamma-glutamate synthesis protein (capsule biosynthesis protein)
MARTHNDVDGQPASAQSASAQSAEGTAGSEHEGAEGQPGMRLTRREFLAGAAVAGAAVAVAGCSPFGQGSTGPFALHRPAIVAFDATVPGVLQPAILKQLAGVAGIPSATSATAGKAADLVVTFGAVPSGYTGAIVGTSPLALFAHMRVPIDEVTHDQALQLLAGQVADWKAVGAPASLAVKLVSLGGLALPSGVALADGAKKVAALDDAIAALRAQPGSLAALPADATDWRVRNLGVDGVYPAQGRGDASKGGLASLSLQVGAAQALVKQGLDPKAVAAALAPALAPVAALDMVAVGDIMLGRGVNNKMVAHRDYTYPYKAAHDDLQSADYRVANLECTITDLVAPPTDPTTFTFISAKKAVEGLVYAGFNAVTVANNHAAGPGKAAMLDMLNTLRTNSIAATGGGANLAEAAAPAVTTAKGIRIALLGYLDSVDVYNGFKENPNAGDVPSGDQSNRYAIPSQGPSATESKWGYSKLLLSTLAQDIANARAKADLVIPYFHWGHEFEGGRYPYKVWKRQQDVSRAAIDAGADMVLGNHPHVTQGIEEYKGKLIVYSMGNFIFDQDWSQETKESIMVHTYWRGTTLTSVRFVPTVDKDRCQPNIMTAAQAVGVFGRMWSSTDYIAAGQYDDTNWWQPVP